MEIILETLQAIDMLENAQASVIADKLNISPSTFSNRIKKLLKKSLVKQTSKGKEKWYSLTETGKHLLGERKDDNEKADNFGDILKKLLSKSFDDTYQLIDIFLKNRRVILQNTVFLKIWNSTPKTLSLQIFIEA